jgi:hypothetical protein
MVKRKNPSLPIEYNLEDFRLHSLFASLSKLLKEYEQKP